MRPHTSSEHQPHHRDRVLEFVPLCVRGHHVRDAHAAEHAHPSRSRGAGAARDARLRLSASTSSRSSSLVAFVLATRTAEYRHRSGRRSADRRAPSAREDREGRRRGRGARRDDRRRRRRLPHVLQGITPAASAGLRGASRKSRANIVFIALGDRRDRHDLRQGVGRARLGAPGRRGFRACGARLRRRDAPRAASIRTRWSRCSPTSWRSWWPRAASRPASTRAFEVVLGRGARHRCAAPGRSYLLVRRTPMCYNGADLSTDPEVASAPGGAPPRCDWPTGPKSPRSSCSSLLAAFFCGLGGGAGLAFRACARARWSSAACAGRRRRRIWSTTGTASSPRS